MDLRVLTKADQGPRSALFDAMHRQRHQVFAVDLGWTALRSDSGLEVDDFDDADARYLVAHEGDEVHGSLRLLPAWRRSMLRECWPQAVGAAEPAFDSTVWEWTRWCPGAASRPRQLVAARRALILAAVAFGQARGARRFVTFCDTKFVEQLDTLGWDPAPLGPVIPYAEGSAIGVGWALRPNALLETAARLRPARARSERAGALELSQAA